VHIEELGPPGPPAVLLHGTIRPDSMRPLAEDLAAAGRHVLLPHLPGYGKTPLPPSYDHDLLREMLVDALRRRIGSQNIAMVGHSFGAYHALRIALDSSVTVRRLVALSAHAGLSRAHCEEFRQLPEALRTGQDLSDVGAERMAAPDFYERHPELRAEVRRWFSEDMSSLAADLEAAAAAPELYDELPSLDLPVYLRVGELDAAVPPGYAAAVHEALPNSSIEVVPRAGHLLPYEDREATARATLEHLRD
jgi:pimeloyl-ACP methyl ester carboxylesterase